MASHIPTQTPTSSSTSLSPKSIPASNRLYDIPSLENDAANFQTWKFRIETILDIRGLLSIVDGTLKCPTDSQSENYTLWKKLDKEARAQICLTLKDEPLNGVLHVATFDRRAIPEHPFGRITTRATIKCDAPQGTCPYVVRPQVGRCAGRDCHSFITS